MRSLFIAATILATAPSLFAQKLWTGGEGVWSDPNKWGGTAPASTSGTANIVKFTASETPANVEIGGTALATAVYATFGANVTFEMQAGAILKTGSLWRIGEGSAVEDGPAHLTIKGPSTGAAQVSLTEGASNNQFSITGGSSLTLEGSGLTMNASGTSVIGGGAAENGNTLLVTNGATFINNAMRVGQITAGNTGSHGNNVQVTGGARVNLYSGATSIGNNVDHYSNFIVVSGANSRLEVEGDASLVVGNSAATNHGGNYLKVEDGGVVAADGGISVFGHTAGSTDHGSNKLTIDAGGTLTSSSTITVGHTTATTFADGVLELREGGTLDGSGAVVVNKGARFEAAGDGLGSGILTTINAGGALAVFSDDEETPGVLVVKSRIDFAAGGKLELTLYDNGLSSTIDFLEGGLLAGTVTLSLDLSGVTLEDGQSWRLFTGDTSLLSAAFDLSGLDSALWDVSRFNSEGGWELRVIPEPQSVAMLLGGSVALAWASRRRKRAILGASVLAPALFAFPAPGIAAEEGDMVKVQASEVEIGEKSEMKFTVALGEASADVERVLEFTAWYQAPKVAGYYAGMRVFWNNEELEDILDRPLTFKTGRGSEVPVRRGKMWQVAVLPSPDAAHGDGDATKGAYRSSEVDVVRFRFPLPSVPAGEYELIIRNNMTAKTRHSYEIFPTLVVQDVEVRSVEK